MPEQTVKGISPQEAWEILQSSQDATLFDVRTTIEYEYVGHPPGACHIPWQEAPGWERNSEFVDRVRAALIDRHGSEEGIESLPVLTLCRSGKRSFAAGEELMRHGFTNVYNIEQGFEGDRDGNKHRSTINGWRFHNLPWEQS